MLQLWPHRCWIRGKAHLPKVSNTSPSAAQDTARPLCGKATLLVRVQLNDHQTPRSFSAKLLSSQVGSSIHLHMRLFFARCRISNFWLNFMWFLASHFSRLLWSLWMAAWPADKSATPPSFVSTNLLRVEFASSPRSLMTMLNRTGPQHCPLVYTANYWPPTRLYAPDHHPLGPTVQPVFSPPQSTFHISSVRLCP